MRSIKAKRIRKSVKYLNPPGYKKISNGQIISPRRMEYQRAKKGE